MYLGKSKILIVDDNETNCTICEEILGGDYAIDIAKDGESALAAAEQFEPDLILLDRMMPGIDGLEVCRRLRHSNQRWVKIIMVSARVQTEDRLAAYEAGADDYVCKPFDEDELLAKVNVHLRLRHVEEIDSVKQRLLDVLQHGHRTPMTHMLGNADLLASMGDQLAPEHRQECIESIIRGARRLHDWLVAGEQLVSLKSRQISFDPTPVDVAKGIRAVLDRLGQGDKPGASRVHVNGPQDLTADLDSDFFELMIDRLTRDAMAYSPEGAAVSLSYEETDGGRLRVSAVREGDAVEAGLLPHLFEPFGAPNEVLHNHGDGLGLAIVREIAVLHGGLVRAINLPQGGVEIQVEIPTKQPEAVEKPKVIGRTS